MIDYEYHEYGMAVDRMQWGAEKWQIADLYMRMINRSKPSTVFHA